MRVVLTTRQSQWIEDWDAGTPRQVAAMFTLKYCRGQRPLETDAPSQFSHAWSTPDGAVSVSVLKLQPAKLGPITPISVARYGVGYTFEQRYVDHVRRLDRAAVAVEADPAREQALAYGEAARGFLRRFGRSIGVKG